MSKRKPARVPRAQPKGKTAGQVQPNLMTLLLGNPDVGGIVCSWAWADAIKRRVDRGQLQHKQQLGAMWRELYYACFYPPGGPKTKMRACLDCGRHCPPSACRYQPNLPGRPQGRCCDCIEDLKAPPPVKGSGHVGTYSPWMDVLLRLSVFIRSKDEEGRTILIPQELKGEALRERQLRRRGSDAQLRAELARYDEGKWMPSKTP